MSISVSTIFQDVKDAIGDKKAYLFGSAIREILSGDKPKVFDVFIKIHHMEKIENIEKTLPVNKSIRYTFGSTFTINDPFTVNMMYVDINDLLTGNIEVKYFQSALKDYNKNSIKFSKEALSDLRPEFIFQAIELAMDTGFHLDPKTITEICSNINICNRLDKRDIYRFLSKILKNKRTRKIISLLNTLGISKELFGYNLKETSIVNHLKPSDVLEYFSIIFSEVPFDNLKDVLVNKCGFFERDTHHVINLSKALESIHEKYSHEEGSESDEAARRLLFIIKSKRINNVARLLKLLNFKELARSIKKQKGVVVDSDNLCIDKDLIKIAFGIENEMTVDTLLEKALDKVIVDPSFNNQTKLLSYLNIERKKLNEN